MRFLLLCLCAVPALAGEFAILSNGFRIRADRHETDGATVRLIGAGGVTELPAAMVSSFEVEEYVRPAKPAEAPASAPATAVQPKASPRDIVDKAAEQTSANPRFKKLTHAVAKAESAYQVDAVSPKGAMGLMQLMPGTAKDLNADPRVPEQNAGAGARYLADLLERYNGDVARAVAAYNAGPGAVDKYNGVPPYRETRVYVNRVIKNYKQLGGD
jgi:soluble lytic murein transglycosylase-like protein